MLNQINPKEFTPLQEVEVRVAFSTWRTGCVVWCGKDRVTVHVNTKDYVGTWCIRNENDIRTKVVS